MKDKTRQLRNEFIKEMIEKGVSKAEIMSIFNLTRQGLYFILKDKKRKDLTSSKK